MGCNSQYQELYANILIKWEDIIPAVFMHVFQSYHDFPLIPMLTVYYSYIDGVNARDQFTKLDRIKLSIDTLTSDTWPLFTKR